MTQLVLSLKDVSKMYRLGEVGTGTLAHDLNRTWARMLGREDPYARIGKTNDRDRAGGDYIWALKDINFDVRRGEIIGIIGRNGAGKSTLLKLLSRVTAPTEGAIHINGRIASLLEVGTGFHPELTGRDNIFLNGAILGMSRNEVRARFDEIVEFSGCAKYIDTPVKRYSSGMYVRLAFAVAAHLETDILIVDEVLAVGDADFQRKCLGMMQSMSEKSDRTVLFVSHNMAAVKRLCPRAILMDRGMIVESGETSDVIDAYLSGGMTTSRELTWGVSEEPGSDEIILDRVAIIDDRGRVDSVLSSADALRIEVGYRVVRDIRYLRIVATVTNMDGVTLFSTSDYMFQDGSMIRGPGVYTSTCHIPGNFLTTGTYRVEINFEIPMDRCVVEPQHLSFTVDELSFNQLGRTRVSKPPGVLHPLIEWNVDRVEHIDTKAS